MGGCVPQGFKCQRTGPPGASVEVGPMEGAVLRKSKAVLLEPGQFPQEWVIIKGCAGPAPLSVFLSHYVISPSCTCFHHDVTCHNDKGKEGDPFQKLNQGD